MFPKMTASAPAPVSGIIADLHIHSTASDGEYSPARIAAMLDKEHIQAAALADHDSFEGFQEFRNAFHGVSVPAVELSVEYEHTGLHLLAYGFDPENKAFISCLEHFQKVRYERIGKMCERLCGMGVAVTLEDVKKNCPPSTTLGRPHIARALIAAGHVKSFNAAFEKYLGDGKSAYVPKARLDFYEALDIIRASGGVSILAHPGLYHRELAFDVLKKLPVDGFEAYHPNHSRSFSRVLIDHCLRHELPYTGGSDFHDLRRNKANVIGKWGLTSPEWETVRSYFNANCAYRIG
ncbi:MAG: PHP domain-containing protein [Candidatus Marinimicrobia bacterium]|nr:PHP domain-containing protein [Candidatus Neomarinimicrobiota bacterium]